MIPSLKNSNFECKSYIFSILIMNSFFILISFPLILNLKYAQHRNKLFPDEKHLINVWGFGLVLIEI